MEAVSPVIIRNYIVINHDSQQVDLIRNEGLVIGKHTRCRKAIKLRLTTSNESCIRVGIANEYRMYIGLATVRNIATNE